MATTDIPPAQSESQILVSAEVLETETSGQYVRVGGSGHRKAAHGWARLATGPHMRPQVGDQVLVMGEAPDNLYVIGCLTPPRAERLQISAGVYAERSTSADGSESLRVLSKEDQLLFEIDPDRGRTRVSVPQGTLELNAARGDIVLSAAGAVRVQGTDIDLSAKHRLTMAVTSGVGLAKSWFRMLHDRLQTGGEKIDVTAREADLNITSTSLTSTSVSVKADDYRLTAQHAETTAETLVENSGNAYRTVRNLLQQQVGRLRTYVSGLSHFRSKRAYFSSEETFHIDGDQVHLG
ncbi:MAG: DUF3540 domain-containing protein [Fuerstiella sp.]